MTGYFFQKYKNLQVSDLSPYTTIWSASNEAYKLITEEARANTDLGGAINGGAGIYFEHFSRPYFNAPDLTARFSRFAWYVPRTWDPELNDIERQLCGGLKLASPCRNRLRLIDMGSKENFELSKFIKQLKDEMTNLAKEKP